MPKLYSSQSEALLLLCSEGIYQGECYLDNQNGEYVHMDCIPDTDWLINWFGFNVEEMNCNYE